MQNYTMVGFVEGCNCARRRCTNTVDTEQGTEYPSLEVKSLALAYKHARAWHGITSTDGGDEFCVGGHFLDVFVAKALPRRVLAVHSHASLKLSTRDSP